MYHIFREHSQLELILCSICNTLNVVCAKKDLRRVYKQHITVTVPTAVYRLSQPQFFLCRNHWSQLGSIWALCTDLNLFPLMIMVKLPGPILSTFESQFVNTGILRSILRNIFHRVIYGLSICFKLKLGIWDFFTREYFPSKTQTYSFLCSSKLMLSVLCFK